MCRWFNAGVPSVVRVELADDRHPHRPPELGRLEVRTDRLPVVPAELSKPVAYGLATPRTGVERDTEDGLTAHPVTAPQCTKNDASASPGPYLEGRGGWLAS